MVPTNRSESILLSLCEEAEWIWRRMKACERSLNRCHDHLLQGRLCTECHSLRARCQELNAASCALARYGHADSWQLNLLNELLGRIKIHSSKSQMSPLY